MNTSPALTPRIAIGWMPFNIGQFLEKTANLDPVSSIHYITTKIHEEMAKAQRFHERARRAAQGRWHPGKPYAPSIAHLDARSIKKRTKKRLKSVRAWITKAPERKEHARRAAQSRWDKIRASAPSIPKEHRQASRARVDTTAKRATEDSSNYHLLSPLPPKDFRPGDAAAAAGEGNPSAVTGGSVARPQRSIWKHRGIRSKAADDPRFALFRQEVVKDYAQQNSDCPECWNGSDERALGRLLEGSSSMTLQTLQRCLGNRRASEKVNPSDPPRCWIADVLRYKDGPLDRFNKPMGITPAVATANVGRVPGYDATYAETARLTDAINQAWAEGDQEKVVELGVQLDALKGTRT